MHLRVLLRHGQTPSEQLVMMKIESTGILVIEVRERLTKLLKLPMDDLMLKVHPGVNFDEVYEDSAKIMDDLNETKNIGVTVPIPICFVQFESKSISESSIYGSAEISVATLANKLRSRFNVTDDKDLRVSRVSSTDALSGRTILRPGDTSLEDPLVVEVIPTVRPIEWIEPRMMIPATIRLTFVNRDDATSKLLSVHSANYDRASTHEGSKFQCPICINDSGSGKSRFALEYQSSVRRLYPNDSSPAVSSLLSAVTVHMPLEEPVMTSWNEKLGSLIKAQVLQMVSNPSVIHGLSGDFIPLVTALIALGNRSVFLVIDDIERGFSRDDDLLSEEHHADELNLVVQNLIQPLMMNPRFFVLICGNAPFLLNSRMTLSPVAYTRISLNMLRPGYICTILDSTQMMGMMNLAEYLGVQEVLASYSSDLYELTGGILGLSRRF